MTPFAVKGDEIRGANGIYNKESRTIGGKYNAIQPNPVAESRVEKMNVLRWASDVENVLTEEELIKCRHNLGNCSESVTWAAMKENQVLSIKEQLSQVPVRDRTDWFLNLDSDPRELIYYINRVAEFGFNHIIIVGETEYGMIFIDCYGRVFMWDDESPMLWPLGNSPEEVPKQTIKGKMC
ncbi:17260_t:CDS:2 [Rhizophagus irregularis]|nr:17260_t:CDS:2 [Rhizophagus irregularis]